MKRITSKIIVLIVVAVSVITAIKTIGDLKEENEQLKSNQEILFTEKESAMAQSQLYKVSDSLNAAKVTELQLSLSEYKKYRKEDLRLIEQLKIKKSDLQKVVSSQSETIYALSTQLKDSVRNNIAAGVTDTLKCFNYNSKWVDVSGCVSTDTVELQIANRESLKVVETVKYKRFLGFLWKTNKIKSRQVSVVSENPYTTITSVEAISIER